LTLFADKALLTLALVCVVGSIFEACSSVLTRTTVTEQFCNKYAFLHESHSQSVRTDSSAIQRFSLGITRMDIACVLVPVPYV